MSKLKKTYEKIDRDIESFDGHVMVSVSGGASSAVCWKRCVDFYGAERVHPVFADTLCESDDTYEFLAAIEEYIGQPLTVLWTSKTDWDVRVGTLSTDKSDGADIRDVFFKYRVCRIPRANNACKASVELKRKPLDQYFLAKGFDAIAVGFQPDEMDRVDRLKESKEACFSVGGCKLLFPVIYPPSLSRCDCLDEVRSWGVKLPAAYETGYDHNNCLKLGCVLQGNKQWVGMLLNDPEAFARAEEWSDRFYKETGFTICRDRRGGGESKPLPLSELRREVENGERFEGDWKSTCGCMSQAFLFDIRSEEEKLADERKKK